METGKRRTDRLDRRFRSLFDEKMPSPAVLQPFHRAVNWTENLGQPDMLANERFRLLARLKDRFAVLSAQDDIDQTPERWIACSLALLAERFEELDEVMALRGEDGDMLRI